MRRIVAVTRGLAHAAVERAKSFEQQLDAADGIDDLSLDTTVCLRVALSTVLVLDLGATELARATGQYQIVLEPFHLVVYLGACG